MEAGEKFLQSLFNVKTGRGEPSTLTEKGIDLFGEFYGDKNFVCFKLSLIFLVSIANI